VILVDTSIWIDHLRSRDEELRQLLLRDMVAVHMMVVGELAMGTLANRSVLNHLISMPRAETVPEEEVVTFVEQKRLFGRGIGLVDVHLLASCVSFG
jgi:predicted nucleic acid-binding protein